MEIETYKNQGNLMAHDQIIDAHNFLLKKFDTAQRGGIHDFMELILFNMVNHAIKKIDDYLQTGHKSVSATEIMHITIDAYQFILDRMKGNLNDFDI